MLVNITQSESTVLRGFRVVGDCFLIVRDNDEAGAVLHHHGLDPQSLQFLQEVSRCLPEVHNVLLRDLAVRIFCDIE